MKTLILMRHAKSSWDTPAGDIERPLNDRGRKSSALLGAWLRTQNLIPDEILCSSAQRTQETVDGLKLGLAYLPQRALYLASASTLFRHALHAVGETVLMVAHNPGIGDCAFDMATEPSPHARFSDYPTGATTVLTFDIDNWSDLQRHTGTITQFVTPREL